MNKKKDNSYCALIQMVGIRDLGEDDPVEYSRAIDSLIDGIKSVLLRKDENEKPRFGETIVHFIIDQCYVQDSNLSNLISFVQDVEIEIIVRGIFVRALIVEGSLSLAEKPLVDGNDEDQKSQLLPNFERLSFQEKKCSSLNAKIESLKAIGASIDLEGSERFENVFANYYIRSMNSCEYVEFTDIRLELKISPILCLDKALRGAIKSLRFSKKRARFFIPLLRNFVEQTFSKKKVGPYDKHLIQILCDSSTLSSLRKITGYEIIYFSLFRKAIIFDRKNPGSGEAKVIIKFAHTNKCFHKHAEDEGLMKIPNSVFNNENRRNLLEAFDRIEAEK